MTDASPEWIRSLPAPPARPDEAHKGEFGRVLIVAGSRGMSGAACLAGLGALRGGAGLVTVAVPDGIAGIVASVEPSYLTVPLPEDSAGRLSLRARPTLDDLLEATTVVACGPGWGQSDDLVQLAGWLYESCPRPTVFDADGLNALTRIPGIVNTSAHSPGAPAARILTPHPGEFARLLKTNTESVQQDREGHALRFARRLGIVLVLKGHHTLITDGARMARNTTGNSGMATGGSGDVLTGLTAALVAQDLTAFDAATLAVHLHGLAGDLAAEQLTKPALIASDLPTFLPSAWKAYEASL